MGFYVDPNIEGRVRVIEAEMGCRIVRGKLVDKWYWAKTTLQNRSRVKVNGI